MKNQGYVILGIDDGSPKYSDNLRDVLKTVANDPHAQMYVHRDHVQQYIKDLTCLGLEMVGNGSLKTEAFKCVICGSSEFEVIPSGNAFYGSETKCKGCGYLL